MNPAWIDEGLYPFEHRSIEVGRAEEIHYLDEGEGETIVFVHGTPTWSFVWREFVRELRSGYRCIAPDHLGFGLSSKPEDADYRPEAHARRFEELVTRLDLRDITLVVHDFGGPIGLSYALEHPENIRRLVVMNSWLWSLEGNKVVESASRLLGGPVGGLLYRRLNFSPKILMRAAFAEKGRLTREIHRHYLAPFPSPAERSAPWVLARELAGSSDWFANLWAQRQALAGVPMLILWGTEDRLVGPEQLGRWMEAFPQAVVERLEGVGHFVQEEGTDQAVRKLKEFVGWSSTADTHAGRSVTGESLAGGSGGQEHR